MYAKVVKFLNKPRVRFFVIAFVIVLFCLVLNIAFSAFTHSYVSEFANIEISGPSFNYTIYKDALPENRDTEIVPANSIKFIDLDVKSNNNYYIDYELLYEVYTYDGSSCKNPVDTDKIYVEISSKSSSPNKAEFNYDSLKTPSEMEYNFRIAVKNTDLNNDYCVKFRIDAGFANNSLDYLIGPIYNENNKEKRITNSFYEDDLTLLVYNNDKLLSNVNFIGSTEIISSCCYSDVIGEDNTCTFNDGGPVTYDATNGVSITGLETGNNVCKINLK